MSESIPVRGRIILDSRVLIELIRRRLRLDDLPIQDAALGIPAVAAGELFFGAHRATGSSGELAAVTRWLGEIQVIVVDLPIAKVYGVLRAQRYRQGSPLPENDIWIAATAIRHSATLFSRDQHFDRVPGLAHQRID